MITNVDPVEIAKFDKLAAKWWDPNGESKPLHAINPIRFEFIQQFVALSGKHILDIGCGGGILTESMAQCDRAKVTGIDLSLAAIKIAEQHQQEALFSIDYQMISAEELAQQKPRYYDVITCMELLEHVPNPEALIKSCAQLLKPEGYLFFSTLNRTFKAYLLAILGAEYLLQMLPKGTHDYDKFIRPAELTNWARKANLTVHRIQGISYNLFRKEFILDKNIDVNYIVMCRPSL